MDQVENELKEQVKREKPLGPKAAFEMANVSIADTGLPYDLWIDSVGKDSKGKHQEPIIKVYVDGKMIPITISENPDIPESVKRQGVRDFPHFEKIKEYIRAYYKVFLAHYNKILTDKEILVILSTLDEESISTAEKVLSEKYGKVNPMAGSTFEVKKEDNLYLVGPFWFMSPTLSEINKGRCKVISKKFLVDYNGRYTQRVSKSKFTHKGIWESELKNLYGGHEYDYYPRGRVSWDSQEHKVWVNIPKGLNEEVLLPLIAKEYDFDLSLAEVKYTDPTSGNHYSFQLSS